MASDKTIKRLTPEPPNNVIKFPKSNKRLADQYKHVPPKSEKSQEHVNYMTETSCTLLLDHLVANGYDIHDPKSYKNLALMIESLKSYIHGSNGKYYPLHPLASRLFIKHKSGACFMNTDFIKNTSKE